MTHHTSLMSPSLCFHLSQCASDSSTCHKCTTFALAQDLALDQNNHSHIPAHIHLTTLLNHSVSSHFGSSAELDILFVVCRGMMWLSVIPGLMSSGLLPRVCAFGVPGQCKTHGHSGSRMFLRILRLICLPRILRMMCPLRSVHLRFLLMPR